MVRATLPPSPGPPNSAQGAAWLRLLFSTLLSSCSDSRTVPESQFVCAGVGGGHSAIKSGVREEMVGGHEGWGRTCAGARQALSPLHATGCHLPRKPNHTTGEAATESQDTQLAHATGLAQNDPRVRKIQQQQSHPSFKQTTPPGHTKGKKEGRGQGEHQQNQQGHPHTTTRTCSCPGGLAKGQALLVPLRHSRPTPVHP